jgi:hemolysin activation/secretion protein
MFQHSCIFAVVAAASTGVSAQALRDAGSVPVRDISASAQSMNDRPAELTAAPSAAEAGQASPGIPTGVFVGAVHIDGGREIPRAAFAPLIERVLGKEAATSDLQALARAIATEARKQGYIFASAMIPEQTVSAGTITVRLDAGSVDSIRISGSNSVRLRRTLDVIVGPAVRTETMERQLLLAGDIPGIVIDSTRYVREAAGNVLIVEVHEDRHSGFIGLDNYGPRDSGPARLRLRYDMTGLIDDDRLTVQVLATPMQPAELGYASVRYARAIGTRGTEIGAAVAVGRTKPGDRSAATRLTGKSAYGAIFVNHPVVRSTRASLWANAELALLRVEQDVGGVAAQRDEIATLTLSTTSTVRAMGGRLWAGAGIVQGLGLAGTTAAGDPMASRFDGSARFTKAFYWANWTGGIGRGFSLRLASNGQLASRPLLAAQEIGLGGPYFGRAYDFSERFGDNGILGLVEMRRQFDAPMKGVNWFQLYGFVDGGYVENLANTYGDGALVSAGGGFRAMLGRTEIGVEAGVPLGEPRYESGNKAPSINLSVGHSF